MDENERARREEIEAKEKRIYDKMDDLRKDLKEAISDAKSEAKADLKEEATKREDADRRIYQKIDAEKDAMAKRLTLGEVHPVTPAQRIEAGGRAGMAPPRQGQRIDHAIPAKNRQRQPLQLGVQKTQIE